MGRKRNKTMKRAGNNAREGDKGMK